MNSPSKLAGLDRPPAHGDKERARDNFPNCSPVVRERFLGLTPEGSRLLARGVLPLDGIRRPQPPTSAPDRAGVFGSWSRGGECPWL